MSNNHFKFYSKALQYLNCKNLEIIIIFYHFSNISFLTSDSHVKLKEMTKKIKTKHILKNYRIENILK
jgi:hypothetical protein